MVLKTLKDAHIAHHRPYTSPDTSLPSYPFGIDPDLLSFSRSLVPPASSPCAHKRSGGMFALEISGEHRLSHLVVNTQDDDSSPGEDGLPEDMQDILRQLDDLASWVKAASSSGDCISIPHPTSHGSSPRKGKSRLLSTSPLVMRQDLVESPRGTLPGNPINASAGTDFQSEGFIYVPNCNTPEFLVGSSSSPIAYPVCGYSSHPPRYSPQPPDHTHDISYHRRFIERRSAPCPPSFPPPSSKNAFKTLFQRSRCNTTVVPRPTIPSAHVPVESALRQGKRMRLPWLRI